MDDLNENGGEVIRLAEGCIEMRLQQQVRGIRPLDLHGAIHRRH